MRLPGLLSAFSSVRWLAGHLQQDITEGNGECGSREACLMHTITTHSHECMYNLCIFLGHGWNIKVQSPRSDEDLVSPLQVLSAVCSGTIIARVCVYVSSLSQQHHTACISFSPRGCVTVLLDWRLCASSFTKYSGYYGRWLIFKPQGFSCPVHAHTLRKYDIICIILCVFICLFIHKKDTLTVRTNTILWT